MPIATTILGKSVISEAHPLFAGIYEGAMGRAEVTELVESADCVLMLGCFLTDINMGIWTAKLDPSGASTRRVKRCGSSGTTIATCGSTTSSAG